jgi:hypothetical protein
MVVSCADGAGAVRRDCCSDCEADACTASTGDRKRRCQGMILSWLMLLRLIDVGKPFHQLMLARYGEVMGASQRLTMHRCITAFLLR